MKEQPKRRSTIKLSAEMIEKVEPHLLSPSECLDAFGTSVTDGLSEFEAQRRHEIFGPNAFREEEQEGIWAKVYEQFSDPMVRLLLGAAVISFLISFFGSHREEAAWVEPSVIFLILIVNALIGIYQDYNAEKSVEMLKKLQAKSCEVIRDKHQRLIDSEHLVPGDIVILRMGEIVPADCRIISLNSPEFEVDESNFTGEPRSISKHPEKIAQADFIYQKSNCVFSATTVQYGSAVALVTSIGEKTELGKIKANVLVAKEDVEDELTPLKKQLDAFGDSLTKIIIVICVMVWLLSIPKFFDKIHGGIVLAALYYFKQAVALGVAAIPEGLPAVITTCLALGTRRMIAKNALVRKLSKVETLGCTTVICSDKTGTLTRNEMFASQLTLLDSKGQPIEWEVSGIGYSFEGTFTPVKHNVSHKNPASAIFSEVCLLNNEASVDQEGKISGSKTECALITLGRKINAETPLDDANYTKLFQFAFTGFRKIMSYLVRNDVTNQNRLLVKGAAEIIVNRSSNYIANDGSVMPLTEENKANLIAYINSVASKAFRVLGVAYKSEKELKALEDLKSSEDKTSDAYKFLLDKENNVEIESKLTLVGFAAIADPVRKEAVEAVERCKSAGICVIMITGDNKETAKAIAKQLNFVQNFKVIEAKEMDDKKGTFLKDLLTETVKSKGSLVFARSSPHHKRLIVKELREMDEIVAMTGDGTNDAPALKQASIGIAMGISGTDVAKEASDIILMDDNFNSIVCAIEEGRTLYANMKDFIKYMISSNIGEVVSIFLTSFLGIPEGFNSIQLLWVNLVTDGVPATALSFNPPDKDIMEKPPRHKDEQLLNRWTLIRFLIIGTYVGLATVGIFVYYYTGYWWSGDGHKLISYHELTNWTKCTEWENQAPAIDLCYQFLGGKKKASTLSLTVLVIIEMLNALNATSENVSLLVTGFFVNPWLIRAIGLSVFLHCMVMYVPFFAKIFSIVPLNLQDWILVMIFSIPILPIEEVIKYFSRKEARIAKLKTE